MKKIYSFTLVVFCLQFANAANEVPNPGFEFWSSGDPVGWYTSNVPGYGVPITQVSPGHSGSYAAKCQAVLVATGDTLPPVLIPGTVSSGIPITANYSTFEFYYQSNLTGGDVVSFTVIIYDAGNAIIGTASEDLSANTSGWTKHSSSISYSGITIATKAVISISLQPDYATGRGYPNPSSYFIIDDVDLTGLVGIEAINSTSKVRVFPVPAHDLLNINVPADQYKSFHLILTDALGHILIERNSNSQSNNFIKDELNLEGFAPGLYSLIIISDEKSLMRKVIVN